MSIVNKEHSYNLRTKEETTKEKILDSKQKRRGNTGLKDSGILRYTAANMAANSNSNEATPSTNQYRTERDNAPHGEKFQYQDR